MSALLTVLSDYFEQPVEAYHKAVSLNSSLRGRLRFLPRAGTFS